MAWGSQILWRFLPFLLLKLALKSSIDCDGEIGIGGKVEERLLDSLRKIENYIIDPSPYQLGVNLEKAMLAVLNLKYRRKKLVVLYNIVSLPISLRIDRSASSSLLPNCDANLSRHQYPNITLCGARDQAYPLVAPLKFHSGAISVSTETKICVINRQKIYILSVPSAVIIGDARANGVVHCEQDVIYSDNPTIHVCRKDDDGSFNQRQTDRQRR